MSCRTDVLLAVLLLAGTVHTSAQSAATWRDPSPHQVRLVTVDENVQLEVLDWGGSGRTIMLLAGSGNTAHVFDDFAPKLGSDGHVYGITRRGYGASSVGSSGYALDRLGEDVAKVLDALSASSVVLVGHSIAGQELSFFASRFPQRLGEAILAGRQRFSELKVPALAIFASPHDIGPWAKDDPAQKERIEAFERSDEAQTEQQAKAFETGVATSTVVRLRNANRYVYLSHEEAVLREIRNFIKALQ